MNLTKSAEHRADLGALTGSEAGMSRAAVVVTAQRVLTASPTVIQVVPLTRTLRGYSSEVTITADTTNGLDADSAAQCQHIRAVATARVRQTVGNIGPVALAQVRDTVAVLLDHLAAEARPGDVSWPAAYLMVGTDDSGRSLTIGVLWADEPERVLHAVTGWPT